MWGKMATNNDYIFVKQLAHYVITAFSKILLSIIVALLETSKS